MEGIYNSFESYVKGVCSVIDDERKFCNFLQKDLNSFENGVVPDFFNYLTKPQTFEESYKILYCGDFQKKKCNTSGKTVTGVFNLEYIY